MKYKMVDCVLIQWNQILQELRQWHQLSIDAKLEVLA